MNIVSTRIKLEREKLGLTREELGQILGVSYSAIAMYEQGNREPNLEVLFKMCNLFNCSLDYLTGLNQSKSNLNLILNLVNGLTIQEANYLIQQLRKSKIQLDSEET